MAGSGGLAESGRAPPDASCDAIRARKTMTSHWRADTTRTCPWPETLLRVAHVARGAPAWTTRAAFSRASASLSGEFDGAAALADDAHLVLVAGKVARARRRPAVPGCSPGGWRPRPHRRCGRPARAAAA